MQPELGKMVAKTECSDFSDVLYYHTNTKTNPKRYEASPIHVGYYIVAESEDTKGYL